MKLVNLLHFDALVNTPVVDPSLFLDRFTAKLNVGEEKQALISSTAVSTELNVHDGFWVVAK